MKLSLSNRILEYLRRYDGWMNGGEVERLSMSAGYKASTASRRLREMASGITSSGGTCPITLERKIEKGSVWYRAKPPVKMTNIYAVLPDGNRELIRVDKTY